MRTGFVFDLDGTLVDSIPGIARGLNLALKALGYPEHSVDAIREMVGKGARELCLASLKGYFNGNVPEEAFEAVHRGFMREYPHTWQEGTVPYPGIREMLIFPMFCLLFQVMRGCLRPCRFFTLHGERTAPASGHQAVFFKLFLPLPL